MSMQVATIAQIETQEATTVARESQDVQVLTDIDLALVGGGIVIVTLD